MKAEYDFSKATNNPYAKELHNEKNNSRGGAAMKKDTAPKSGCEFTEQILADLIKQGYSGDELQERLKEEQKKIRPAVEALIAEADNIAAGKSEGATFDDVFGTEK